MWRPTALDPVKLTIATCSLLSKTSATSVVQGTTLRTPAGAPAACTISASLSAVSGASVVGRSTTVLPAASAGATLCATRLSGKVNGGVAAITPIGGGRGRP